MGYLYLWRCVCGRSTTRKLAIKVLWVTALWKLTGGICSTVYSVAATGGKCPEFEIFWLMIKILDHVGFWIVHLFKNCTYFFWFIQQMFSPSWPIMSRSDLSWDPLSSGLNSGRQAILGKMVKQTNLWFSPQFLSTPFLLISASLSFSAAGVSPLLLPGVPPRIEVHSWTHSHWGARRIRPF